MLKKFVVKIRKYLETKKKKKIVKITTHTMRKYLKIPAKKMKKKIYMLKSSFSFVRAETC